MTKLETLAIQAMKNSYSPYSKFVVGAAVELDSGDFFSGTNIENSSYGASVCAERVSIWKAISEKGPGARVKALAIATTTSPPSPPCGICRQILSEFADGDVRVTLVNPNGERVECSFDDLLPHRFDPKFLKD